MTPFASIGQPAWFCLNCDGTFRYMLERVPRRPTRRDASFEREWRRRVLDMYPRLPRDVDMSDFESMWHVPESWLPGNGPA